jgi:hypothetical protein
MGGRRSIVLTYPDLAAGDTIFPGPVMCLELFPENGTFGEDTVEIYVNKTVSMVRDR